MARFTEQFLEEVRKALPVSRLAESHSMKLTRAGAEFKALSPFGPEKTPSFTINDKKEMFFDFSSGRNGNVFQLEMGITGCTFEQAVERCARLAGISLPNSKANGSANGRASHVGSRDHAPEADRDDPGYGAAGSGPAVRTNASARTVVATYDYVDPDGTLTYQVCRVEWLDKGKRKKSFLQRRPVDGHEHEWAWGLKGGEYVRGRSGEWFFDDGDRKDWEGPRVTMEPVAHTLYRLPAIREEISQDADDRRLIFLPEGERKVEVHEAWGLVATCSSGGARHWLPHHAEELIGADVIIEADNDKAGREGAEKKAVSLRNIAARVRVLDWGTAWPACPAKGDVVDFRDAGHTQTDLFKIVDGLKDWTPARPESSFGAFGVSELDKPGPRLRWLVKRVLTRGELSIWFGDYGCGKSFLITDCAMSIDRGIDWMNNRVERGLVVYQAGEGGLGFRDRLRAYEKTHGKNALRDSMIKVFPSRVNLFRDNTDVERMITEMNAWSAYYSIPLVLVVIDTMSSATTGADENAGHDMSLVLERARRISLETGAHVAIVHHVPKGGGTPRGWSGLGGNVETLIRVEKTDNVHAEVVEDGRRVLHTVRKFSVVKQKDAADGWERTFFLKQVIIGKDEDDEDVTSCVVKPVETGQPEQLSFSEAPVGFAILKQNNAIILRALAKAIETHGTFAPPDVKAPQYTKVVKVGDWIGALCELKYAADVGDPPTEKFPFGVKLHARCKKAIERTYTEYGWIEKVNLIGKDREYVWRTTRKAVGVDEAPQQFVRRDQAPILAPNESVDDLVRTDGLL